MCVDVDVETALVFQSNAQNNHLLPFHSFLLQKIIAINEIHIKLITKNNENNGNNNNNNNIVIIIKITMAILMTMHV